MSAAEGARNLISMGLEVDSDSDHDGALASARVLDLIGEIDHDLGLLEILASLINAAEGAADIHEGMENDPHTPDEHKDPNMVETVAALKRFAAHITAARKELT